MNGWQVQAMWEADAAAEWERINEPDPAESQMKEAAESLEVALDKFNAGLDMVADAMISLADTPMQYKVGSCMEGIENLVSELGTLKEHYERGERE